MSPIQKLITPETIARSRKVAALKIGECITCTSESEARAVADRINRIGHSVKTCHISPRRWEVFKLALKKNVKAKDVPPMIDFAEIEIPAPLAAELLANVNESLADSTPTSTPNVNVVPLKKLPGKNISEVVRELGCKLSVIESNIPIPTARNCKRGGGRYFATVKGMQVNDSVLVPNEKEAQALGAEIKHQGWKSTTRIMAGGFRVWRTA